MAARVAAILAVGSLAVVATLTVDSARDVASTVHAASADPPAWVAAPLPTGSTIPAAAPSGAAWGSPDPRLLARFEQPGRGHDLIPVYVPSELPVGTEGVSGPLPAASSKMPSSAFRVIMRSGEAWIMVMEGMAGDLGDLPGEEVPSVDGHRARAYRVLGGHLVQWSDSGVWYGVYGLATTRDTVARIASGMVLRSRW